MQIHVSNLENFLQSNTWHQRKECTYLLYVTKFLWQQCWLTNEFSFVQAFINASFSLFNIDIFTCLPLTKIVWIINVLLENPLFPIFTQHWVTKKHFFCHCCYHRPVLPLMFLVWTTKICSYLKLSSIKSYLTKLTSFAEIHTLQTVSSIMKKNDGRNIDMLNLWEYADCWSLTGANPLGGTSLQ